MALVRPSMVVTYYTKLLCTGPDRHSSILMSLLFLVAEAINIVYVCFHLIIVVINDVKMWQNVWTDNTHWCLQNLFGLMVCYKLTKIKIILKIKKEYHTFLSYYTLSRRIKLQYRWKIATFLKGFYLNVYCRSFNLKSQWQIWDILLGASTLGVLFTIFFSFIWQVVFKLG